ncbi:MAG: prepilin-type N-terminal cleavage/methylation domain-containing protein [Phycisphaerales bacterium]
MHAGTKAFTLVEIIVVIVVIGILAAVAIPKFVGAQEETAVAAAAEDLKAIELAVDMYHAMHNAYPPDVNRTRQVDELTPFFKADNPFAKPCPIGGVYDWEGPPRWNPPQVAIRKNGSNVYSDADALALDEHFDDGNLSTGRFRRDGSQRLTFYLGAD